MTGSEYQKLAMRTNDGKSNHRLYKKVLESRDNVNPICKDMGGLIMGCLGLAGESGEFTDMIKKWVFHEKELDVEHAVKELGDVMWYVAMICESFGWDLNEIMKINIMKLRKRYPDGFSVDKANNRKEADV